MCRIAETCPKFELGNPAGRNNACKHCHYLKQEKKRLFWLKIISGLTLITFLVSSYIIFNGSNCI